MIDYTNTPTEILDETQATDHLERFLGYLFIVLKRALPGSPAERRHSREARQAMRALNKACRHNARVSLKWAMLRCKGFRETVLDELGGETALARWERCFQAAEQRSSECEPAERSKSDKSQPKRSEIKTDSAGQFRLAPIRRARLQSPEPKSYVPDYFKGYDWEIKPRSPIDMEALFKDCRFNENGQFEYDYDWDQPMPPIPLLPHELRGVGIEDDPELNKLFEQETAKQATQILPKANLCLERKTDTVFRAPFASHEVMQQDLPRGFPRNIRGRGPD